MNNNIVEKTMTKVNRTPKCVYPGGCKFVPPCPRRCLGQRRARVNDIRQVVRSYSLAERVAQMRGPIEDGID